MQTVYKLRHIPTGLFYGPVKGRWKDDKTHISKHGKVYTSKHHIKDFPSYINVSKTINNKFDLGITLKRWGHELETPEKDWEVVEYNLTEINK